MGSFLSGLFDTQGFPPRWNCGSGWAESPGWGWLHIGADVATFLAYYAVPCVVVYFVARQQSVRFPKLFYLFLGLIFFSCGTVHLIEAGIFWWPAYRLSGLLKLITALVSCTGVIVLARMLPNALELKPGDDYRKAVRGRKKAEASLQQERFLLTTLLEQLPEAIYIKDREGRFLRVSQKLAERLGARDAESVIGKTDAECFSAEYAKQAYQDEQRLLAGGPPIIGKEECPLWPSGKQSWVSSTKIGLRNEQGEVVGTLGISHDISEQKQAEEYLRGVVEAAPVSLLVVTDTGKISLVNSQTGVLFGYSKEELIGQPIEVLVPNSSREAHVQYRTRYFQSPSTTPMGPAREFHGLAKDGRLFPIAVGLSPLETKSGTLVLCCVQDLTSQHEAEKAIRASEERFALAVRGSADGLWDWDVVTNVVYYAPRFKELIGYKDDEFPNTFEAFETHLHPDDHDRIMEQVNEHIYQRVPYDVEYRLRTKSGNYRHFRARGQAIWNADGHATRMAGSITDITSRKLAEEQLSRIALHLALPRAMPSTTPEPISLSDFSLKDMISCGADIRGMSLQHQSREGLASALVNYLYDRIHNGENTPAFALVRLFQTRTLAELDEELRLLAQASCTENLDAQSCCLQLLGTVGADAEWCDPKRSKGHRVIALPDLETVAKLPMISQLFNQLGFEAGGILQPHPEMFLEGVGTSVFHVEEAQGSDYIPAQEQFVIPFGIRSVVGFGDLLPNGQLFAVICFSKVPISGQTAKMFSHLAISTKLALLAFDESGSRVESQILAVDRLLQNYEEVVCSQESRLRIALRDLKQAKEAAEAANRTKSDFLANMSHEIRTPMNAIIGMTDLVLDTRLTPTQQEYLQIARESAESLLALINEILDFSKIEAGRLELESVDFDLSDEVGDALKSVAVRAHLKNLELAWHIQPDVPNALRGDPTRLRQILLNLVGNAIKFTQQGEVVLSIAKLSQSETGVCLRFSIKDTGIGIPPDKLAKVFAPFEQGDTSTTRQFGGTGLGLTITSRIVEAMRGRVWFESEVGKGSTVHVECEFALGESPSPRKSRPLLDLAGVPIVVVDDNSTNRLILREILTRWGMQVHVTENATHALDTLLSIVESGHETPFLLSDINMPNMDGFTLAEQVRSQQALEHTFIILLTSGMRYGDLGRCEELGIFSHLLKPIKPSDLLNTLCDALGGLIEIPVGPAEAVEELPTLNILLVEDGYANQQLATALLEKWGHHVVVAQNGLIAVETWEAGSFDLILMDVQMPVMDGFEATREIRQREQGRVSHIPIIAMTARAMKGDRELCLEAGMDAYISKPIHREELSRILKQQMQAVSTDVKQKVPAGQTFSKTGLVNWAVAWKDADQDESILRIVIEATLEELPRLQSTLREVLAAKNATEVQRMAHTIKAAGRTFGVETLIQTAGEIELQAANQQLSELDGQIVELRQICQSLLAELQAALAKGNLPNA